MTKCLVALMLTGLVALAPTPARTQSPPGLADLKGVSAGDRIGAAKLVHFELADAAHPERRRAQLDDAVDQCLLHLMDRPTEGGQQ